MKYIDGIFHIYHHFSITILCWRGYENSTWLWCWLWGWFRGRCEIYTFSFVPRFSSIIFINNVPWTWWMIWAIFFSVTSLYLWNASHFSRANKITMKNYRYITLSIDSNDISIDTTSHILEEDPGHLIWVSARHPTSGDDEGTQSGTKVGKIFHIWIFRILIIFQIF